jgi:hypothetical protein
MRILIAVILIFVVCLLLFALFYNTKTYIKKDKSHYNLDLFSYNTFIIMVGIAVMGYLFVLYAKAF